MFKVTPNPPVTDSTSPSDPSDSTTFDKAAKRALDFYLKPEPPETQPDQLFTVVNGIDTECLLANLSETLASANAMACDLAFDLDGSRRHVALGIQQLIELGGLLANRALDNVDPR
ncbi:DUF6124 family protein [Pseudomonas sp. B21-028]|uniref:DUF6124 family protein n=1 Tax=Pseudomonas sp. B21-028 TaxID=2895480 RepID=UPI002160F119|nr:DUF6124 family protein [Pseudomonas sp. B21-028]UVL84621.1 DUF6124 family protein [Pseudomonas sp. B21-028]